MTTRLYYDDPGLLAFEAVVVACEHEAGAWRVALDRSAFYPTSGGQAHDLGVLRAGDTVVPVHDVSADDTQVWHAVTAPLQIGDVVHGAVDGPRRRDARQQHSGQHILSASFDLIEARTQSVHLGEEVCTLDLHREVSAAECRHAEDHANTIVWDDRPVAIRYAEAADLASESRLRRPTTRTGPIRLIDIGGHDLSACGGTHVHRTGEVGSILVRGVERVRGGSRVTFVCGRKALESYRELRLVTDEAARSLSIGPALLARSIEKLRDDLKAEQRSRRLLADRLTAFEVAALDAQFTTVGETAVLVAHLGDADAGALRDAASTLTTVPGRLVTLLGGPAPHALAVARSADLVDIDAASLVREICAAHGGKGGGRADLAQAGGVGVSLDQLTAITTRTAR